MQEDWFKSKYIQGLSLYTRLVLNLDMFQSQICDYSDQLECITVVITLKFALKKSLDTPTRGSGMGITEILNCFAILKLYTNQKRPCIASFHAH